MIRGAHLVKASSECAHSIRKELDRNWGPGAESFRRALGPLVSFQDREYREILRMYGIRSKEVGLSFHSCLCVCCFLHNLLSLLVLAHLLPLDPEWSRNPCWRCPRGHAYKQTSYAGKEYKQIRPQITTGARNQTFNNIEDTPTGTSGVLGLRLNSGHSGGCDLILKGLLCLYL